MQENPYEPPKMPSDGKPRSRSSRLGLFIAGLILIGLGAPQLVCGLIEVGAGWEGSTTVFKAYSGMALSVAGLLVLVVWSAKWVRGLTARPE